jgi:hypothetical protein
LWRVVNIFYKMRCKEPHDPAVLPLLIFPIAMYAKEKWKNVLASIIHNNLKLKANSNACQQYNK